MNMFWGNRRGHRRPDQPSQYDHPADEGAGRGAEARDQVSTDEHPPAAGVAPAVGVAPTVGVAPPPRGHRASEGRAQAPDRRGSCWGTPIVGDPIHRFEPRPPQSVSYRPDMVVDGWET
ncbi:MAG: hypothetical protein JXA67_09495, partial [Micromonosporaceae bacterium]|nr:hypothetical protein [Micromonosporaceae bacterium]